MDKTEWKSFEEEVLFPCYDKMFLELGNRRGKHAGGNFYAYSTNDLANLYISFIEQIDDVKLKRKILIKTISYMKEHYGGENGR